MTAQSAQRLCIRLDPAMLLEGLLLARLSLVPKARRQEWLRGLLIQGFLWEGRTSRGAQRDAEVGRPDAEQGESKEVASTTPFAGWLTRPQAAMHRVVAEGSRSPQAASTSPIKPLESKRFAHVRKVIG